MRIILFFDLPTTAESDRRAYSKFRKFLINEGYIMLQESVYSKLALNQTNADLAVAKLKKNQPPSGLVQALKITEKQFSSIENLTGSKAFIEIDTMDRMVIL